MNAQGNKRTLGPLPQGRKHGMYSLKNIDRAKELKIEYRGNRPPRQHREYKNLPEAGKLTRYQMEIPREYPGILVLQSKPFYGAHLG